VILAYCLSVNRWAAVQASDSVFIRYGTFLHPPLERMDSSCSTVRDICCFEHRSDFVTTTNVGTWRAMQNPRCSLVVPTEI